MELNLLQKTELWINNLKLRNADLNEIAAVVSRVLKLPREKVLVVDVRDEHITLDILEKTLSAENFFGREKEILRALSEVEGVEIFPNTSIHSDGVLGSIALSEEEAKKALENSKRMAREMTGRIKRRVIVFPTGFEVKRGMIKDTNTPLICSEMEREGFSVSSGEVIADDTDLIAGRIRRAINEGYGIVITTGGIGAEDKDRTVEGILKIDSRASTPYIIKFQKGTGRHHKDGVRIAVGEAGPSLIIALPGPNDEVKLCLDVIKKELTQGTTKEKLAQSLAEILREKWRNKYHTMAGHH